MRQSLGIQCAAVFVYLTCVIVCAGNIDSADGLEALEKAFQKSSKTDYIAEIEYPQMPEYPEITKAVYYRRCMPDGEVLLRADFHDATGLSFSFMSNKDGQFAIGHRKKLAARGGAFQRLFFLESMNNRPLMTKAEYFTCDISDITFGGRACSLLVIKIVDDVGKEGKPKLHWVTGFLGSGDGGINELIPYTREFIIDKEQGNILAIRKYDASGKLYQNSNLGAFVLSPDWGKYSHNLFDSPKKTHFDVSTAGQFRSILKSMDKTPREKRGLRYWQVAAAFAILEILTIVLMAFIYCNRNTKTATIK